MRRSCVAARLPNRNRLAKRGVSAVAGQTVARGRWPQTISQSPAEPILLAGMESRPETSAKGIEFHRLGAHQEDRSTSRPVSL